MNLDRVSSGNNVPDEINVIIEIPAHSDPVKYEVDKDISKLLDDYFQEYPNQPFILSAVSKKSLRSVVEFTPETEINIDMLELANRLDIPSALNQMLTHVPIGALSGELALLHQAISMDVKNLVRHSDLLARYMYLRNINTLLS